VSTTRRRYAETTTVPAARSREEIETLVERYGASNFTSGWIRGRQHGVSFAAHGRLVRFTITLPTAEDAIEKAPRRYSWQEPSKESIAKWLDQETRRLWRCLLLAIKAKLEVVDSGIHTFEQEFLAHVVTTDNRTVYESLKLADSGVRMLEAGQPMPEEDNRD